MGVGMDTMSFVVCSVCGGLLGLCIAHITILTFKLYNNYKFNKKNNIKNHKK